MERPDILLSLILWLIIINAKFYGIIGINKRSILKKRQMAIPIRSAASTFKKFLKIKKFFKMIILKIELL
ncbi:hypothetical protein HpHA157_04080 [Helicobacter pylori]